MELLVVLGIIAILAALVIVAINPARQFAQARDSQRESNIEAILNAIGERMADNKGVFEGNGCGTILAATSTIDNSGSSNGNGHIDLATNCLVPAYIPSLPIDPSASSPPSTGYEVSVNSDGRIMVCAPLAANEKSISANPPAICVTR